MTNSPGSIRSETLSTAVTFLPPEPSNTLTRFFTLTLLDADKANASLTALHVRNFDAHPVQYEFQNAGNDQDNEDQNRRISGGHAKFSHIDL